MNGKDKIEFSIQIIGKCMNNLCLIDSKMVRISDAIKNQKVDRKFMKETGKLKITEEDIRNTIQTVISDYSSKEFNYDKNNIISATRSGLLSCITSNPFNITTTMEKIAEYYASLQENLKKQEEAMTPKKQPNYDEEVLSYDARTSMLENPPRNRDSQTTQQNRDPQTIIDDKFNKIANYKISTFKKLENYKVIEEFIQSTYESANMIVQSFSIELSKGLEGLTPKTYDAIKNLQRYELIVSKVERIIKKVPNQYKTEIMEMIEAQKKIWKINIPDDQHFPSKENILHEANNRVIDSFSASSYYSHVNEPSDFEFFNSISSATIYMDNNEIGRLYHKILSSMASAHSSYGNVDFIESIKKSFIEILYIRNKDQYPDMERIELEEKLAKEILGIEPINNSMGKHK